MKLQVFANIKRKKSGILNTGSDHWDFQRLCTSWRLKVDHGSDDGEFDFRKAIYLDVFLKYYAWSFLFCRPILAHRDRQNLFDWSFELFVQ